MRLLFRLPVLALLLAEEVSSHGALVKPPGRNAVDRFLPQFAGGTSPMTSCNCGDQRNGCEQVRWSSFHDYYRGHIVLFLGVAGDMVSIRPTDTCTTLCTRVPRPQHQLRFVGRTVVRPS